MIVRDTTPPRRVHGIGPSPPTSERLSRVVKTLAAISCFEPLSAADLEDLARKSVRRQYDTGQVILLQGEACGGLYVVEDGWLKVTRLNSAGREQVIRTVGPGEHFNEISVFADSPNSATIIALEPVSVCMLSRETVYNLLDEHPLVARSVIRSLARSVLEMVDLVAALSLRTVEARLARLLLDGAEESEGVVARPRWATQAEIAARLGTVPDVLNRSLRKLSDEGLIEVKRARIRVLDRRGLEARAEGEG